LAIRIAAIRPTLKPSSNSMRNRPEIVIPDPPWLSAHP
jgi:hypothetical protein